MIVDISFEPTYKEWKHLKHGLPLKKEEIVSSLPIRNGNRFPEGRPPLWA